MKLISGRKIDFVKSRFCFFWTESLTCLAFLTPMQLVVVQLSLLTRNTLGIPARPPKVRLGGNSLPFSALLESSRVKWYTVSQGVAKIVDVGSMRPYQGALSGGPFFIN